MGGGISPVWSIDEISVWIQGRDLPTAWFLRQETDFLVIYVPRWFLVHSQILLPVFIDGWVRKNSFCLTGVLGERLTYLSAFDSEVINPMALGPLSKNPGRNQLASDSPSLSG